MAVVNWQVWPWEVHLPCSASPILILANIGFLNETSRATLGNCPRSLCGKYTFKEIKGKFKMLK